MFNSNSKFKRLNLAEKALVLNFVPDPRVRGKGVSERSHEKIQNSFHSVPIKISRYAFFFIAQLNVRLKYVYFLFLLIVNQRTM